MKNINNKIKELTENERFALLVICRLILKYLKKSKKNENINNNN